MPRHLHPVHEDANSAQPMPNLEDYLNLPYTVALRRDEQGEYAACIDELSGLSAHGRTPQEALGNLEEAKKVWIKDCVKRGDPIPAPQAPAQRPVRRSFAEREVGAARPANAPSGPHPARPAREGQPEPVGNVRLVGSRRRAPAQDSGSSARAQRNVNPRRSQQELEGIYGVMAGGGRNFVSR